MGLPIPEALRRRPARSATGRTRSPGISSRKGALLKCLSSVVATFADCGTVSVIVPTPGVAADIKNAEPDSINGDPFPPAALVVAL